MISVVVETYNLADGDLAPLARSIQTLAPRLAALRVELIITTTGSERIALAYPARWLVLPEGTDYYVHKTLGFAASRGDIVAFLDGDCAPVANWLDAITQPFTRGARVVAGATSYPGPLARIANEMDFPYFDRNHRRSAAGSAPLLVENFFANNVAFARRVFEAHPYRPAPMFHGQCQLLALELREAGIPIHHASGAYVEHAWPGSARELVMTRLLRGADCASLVPHVLRAHVRMPDIRGVRPLSQLAALAVLGVRGAMSAVKARTARELAFVATATALDGLGAIAGPWVYRHYGVRATDARAADPARRTADIAA